MFRNLVILAVSALVVSLPFIFRPARGVSDWRTGDPELVIITPHNEAIRFEFAEAFSAWHAAHFGRPVKIDWRTIGGTTEIMRYLEGEYVASFRAWWKRPGRRWPEGGGEAILDSRFRPDHPPEDMGRDAEALADWQRKKELHRAFRQHDDPATFTARIDLFFGGGAYDHGKAASEGLVVAPWSPSQPPEGLLATAGGEDLIPLGLSGEIWRSDFFFGTCLSTFGICYNVDRLRDLGVDTPPTRWEDLGAPAYAGHLGVADPTKSGSIAKAFEMIVHEQCHRSVSEAGFTPAQAADFEARMARAHLADGELPDGVPADYQAAVERGWLAGLHLLQRISANARYFTDSASTVPIDVSMGNAAAGLAIDFYGRYQAQMSRKPDGTWPMIYVTPLGGSSVSADPISLLRGAEHRETAVRFITFVLSTEGQKLWNYRPGTPGGPRKFALRRLPIRRDFYPSPVREMQAVHREHVAFCSDALGDPGIDPYALAEQFQYYPRWTGRHFNVLRDLIRAMCLDSGEELQAAWRAILAHGGPEQQPEAMAVLGRMPDRPEPFTWTSALGVGKRHARLDYMRAWTLFFRDSYREARRIAEGN